MITQEAQAQVQTATTQAALRALRQSTAGGRIARVGVIIAAILLALGVGVFAFRAISLHWLFGIGDEQFGTMGLPIWMRQLTLFGFLVGGMTTVTVVTRMMRRGRPVQSDGPALVVAATLFVVPQWLIANNTPKLAGPCSVTVPCFDNAGRALRWFARTSDGRYELFDRVGNHPVTGERLQEVTPDISRQLQLTPSRVVPLPSEPAAKAAATPIESGAPTNRGQPRNSSRAPRHARHSASTSQSQIAANAWR